MLWSFPEQSLERGPPCAIRARGGGWHVGALLEEPFSRPHAGSKAKAGAVRFAPSQPGEGNPGHVHFDEKLRDSAVMVTQERDGHVLVKVLAGLWGAVLRCGVLAGGGRGAGCRQGCTTGPRPLSSRNKGLRGAPVSQEAE